MAFTAIRVVNDLHNLGTQRTEYEEESKKTLTSLRQLRQSPYHQKADEKPLVEKLIALEENNRNATQQTALDLSHRAIKVCAGPAAGFTAKVAAGTIKKQINGSSENLTEDLADSLLEASATEIQNQTTSSFFSKAAEWGADLVGAGVVAGAVAMAPVATAAIVTTGVLACATIPTLREKCWSAITTTLKGTEALVSGAAEQIFETENPNKLVIDDYSLYEKKRATVLEKTDLEKSEELKLTHSQNTHAEVSENLSKKAKLTGFENTHAEVSENLPAVTDHLRKRRSTGLGRYDKKHVKWLKKIELKKTEEAKLALSENAHTQVSENLYTVTNHLRRRRSKGLGRFVYRLKRHLLTRNVVISLFCKISKRFKRENSIQKKLSADIVLFEGNLLQINSEIDTLNRKIDELSKKILKKSVRVGHFENS